MILLAVTVELVPDGFIETPIYLFPGGARNSCPVFVCLLAGIDGIAMTRIALN